MLEPKARRRAPQIFWERREYYRDENGLFPVTKGVQVRWLRSCFIAQMLIWSVQHLLDDNVQQKSNEEIYESILCFACTRLHFFNKKTGKLLGQAE
jgi:hypothetical protein